MLAERSIRGKGIIEEEQELIEKSKGIIKEELELEKKLSNISKIKEKIMREIEIDGNKIDQILNNTYNSRLGKKEFKEDIQVIPAKLVQELMIDISKRTNPEIFKNYCDDIFGENVKVKIIDYMNKIFQKVHNFVSVESYTKKYNELYEGINREVKEVIKHKGAEFEDRVKQIIGNHDEIMESYILNNIYPMTEEQSFFINNMRAKLREKFKINKLYNNSDEGNEQGYQNQNVNNQMQDNITGMEANPGQVEQREEQGYQNVNNQMQDFNNIGASGNVNNQMQDRTYDMDTIYGIEVNYGEVEQRVAEYMYKEQAGQREQQGYQNVNNQMQDYNNIGASSNAFYEHDNVMYGGQVGQREEQGYMFEQIGQRVAQGYQNQNVNNQMQDYNNIGASGNVFYEHDNVMYGGQVGQREEQGYMFEQIGQRVAQGYQNQNVNNQMQDYNNIGASGNVFYEHDNVIYGEQAGQREQQGYQNVNNQMQDRNIGGNNVQEFDNRSIQVYGTNISISQLDEY